MRLSTQNLKAHDIDMPLTSATGKLLLLAAPNASGKSTVYDALCIAALGHVPKHGKHPSSTAALARALPMIVRLTLDDGRWIERTLDSNGRGGYVTTTRVSWVDAPRNEEHEMAALALFGANAEEVARALDVRELLSLSDNKRAAEIQALLEAGSDTEALAAAVARRWVQRLAAVSDDRMPEDHRALRPLIPGYAPAADPDNPKHLAGHAHGGQFAVLEGAVQQMVSKLGELGLGGLLSWAREKKNTAHREIAQDEAAREAMVTRLQEVGQPSPDRVTALEGRRQELDREIGAVREHEQTAQAAATQRAAAHQALALATRDLEQAQAARGLVDAADAGAQRARLAEIQAALDAHEAPAAPDTADLDALEAQAREFDAQAAAIRAACPAADDDETAAAALTAAAGTVVLPEIPSTAGAEEMVAEAERRLAVAQASPLQAVLAEAFEIAAHAGTLKGRDTLQALCSAHVETVRRVVAEGGQSVEACAERLAEARRILAERQQAAAAATALRAEGIELQQRGRADAEALRARAAEAREAADAAARAERERFQAEAQTLRAQATAQRSVRIAAHRDLTTAHQQQTAAQRAERDRLQRDVAALDAEDRRTQDAITKARAAADAAAERLAALPEDAGTPADATARLATLETDLTSVAAELDILWRAATTHDEFNRLVERIFQRSAEETVYKALVVGIERVRDETLDRAGGPIAGPMRRFLQAAGRTEAPYVFAKQMGWRTAPTAESPNGNEVNVEALSGAEWVLWTTAFLAAVLSLRKAPVKVLLSEAAETVDSPGRPSLTELLTGIAAVAEPLTAVVVLTPNRPAGTVDGWHIEAPRTVDTRPEVHAERRGQLVAGSLALN